MSKVTILSKPNRIVIASKGVQGPPGPEGPEGIQGEKGDTGDVTPEALAARDAAVDAADAAAQSAADAAAAFPGLDARVTDLEENPAFPDAPDDGGAYIRVNGAWVQLYAPLALAGGLPDGTVDEAYSATLEASGGRPPYTLGDVLLPPGLDATLADATVTVTGTPTEAWEGDAHIDLSDSLGTAIRRVLDVRVVDNTPVLLSPPEGFDWTPPVNIYRSPSGVYSTDFNADDWKVPATDDIWVSPTGSDTAGNGTEESPYRGIRKALQEAAARADVPYNIFVHAGEYQNGINFSNTQCDRDINLIAVGGRALCTNKSPITSWSADGTGTYVAARTNAFDVRDARFPVTWPDGAQTPQLLTKVADLATCQATPASWHSDGASVWVHLQDGREPDAGPGGDVGVIIAGNIGVFSHARRYFIQGFDFEGGTLHQINTQPPAGVQITRLVVDDCTHRFQRTNTGKGINVRAVETAILHNCRAYEMEGDAFSYSQVSAGNPSANAVEINCRAYKCGYPTTSAGIINGSTTHADCRIVRVNSVYRDTFGPVVADINRTQNWCLGVDAQNSLQASGDSQDSSFQAGNPTGDTVKTWLDGCVTGGAHFDIYAGSGCQVLYRNMELPASVGGSGVIDTY